MPLETAAEGENIMKHFRLGLVLLGALPLAPAMLSAQTAYARPANVAIHTPKVGSTERKAIMDALRVPVQKASNGRRPTFTGVREFRVGGGWAHLSCAVIDSKGKPMEPEMQLDCSALLHRVNGKWRVVEWAYHGDVIEIEWAHKHPDVPLNVLGLKPSDLR